MYSVGFMLQMRPVRVGALVDPALVGDVRAVRPDIVGHVQRQDGRVLLEGDALGLLQQRRPPGRVEYGPGLLHQLVELRIAVAAAVQPAGALAVVGFQHLGEAEPGVAGAVAEPDQEGAELALAGAAEEDVGGHDLDAGVEPIRLQNWATACAVLASST